MSKLTAAQIIAMARAQGIHLQEAGATSSQAPGAVDALRRMTGERDSLRLALDEANKRASDLEGANRKLAEHNAIRQDALNGSGGELAEARAQIVALERTVLKLRAVAHVDASPSAAEAVGAHVVGSAVVRITFQGAQGSGTADALKSHGARWTFTNKRGEPVKGYWTAPASPELDNTLLALREAGRAFTAVREFASDTK